MQYTRVETSEVKEELKDGLFTVFVIHVLCGNLKSVSSMPLKCLNSDYPIFKTIKGNYTGYGTTVYLMDSDLG